MQPTPSLQTETAGALNQHPEGAELAKILSRFDGFEVEEYAAISLAILDAFRLGQSQTMAAVEERIEKMMGGK